MSAASQLVNALKSELKASGVTYAELARRIGMAESSIKRMFAKGDMSIARVDEVLRALKIDFTDLARRVAETRPLLSELTLEQERALCADRKLLLVAICVMSLWTAEQITTAYKLTEPECVARLVQLDRLGILELRPGNRYRLKLGKTFRWHPHGPVMAFFRERVIGDYFAGGFANAGEALFLVHGSISKSLAPSFVERMQRLGQEFSQQHLADQKLPPDDLEGFSLILAMRSWEFNEFTEMRRRGLDAGALRRAST
jgi:transcriptional regulator with XRE-family HTH domain